jgi:hypothetical protein
MLRQVSFTTLVVLAAACGSSSNTPDAKKSIDSGSGGGSATWTQVYTNVIMPNCGCHTSAGGEGITSGKLDMTSQAMAFTDLVGVDAMGTGCGTSGDIRVIAGSAAESLLYRKIDSADTALALCGGSMPLGGQPVSADDILQVKEWINAGAQNN